MNDFTKQELEEIEDGLILSLQQPHCDSTWANSVRDLRKKIQSMIDDYKEDCKHPSTNFDDGIYYCNECGYCVP